jgi:hypothetical protein
VRIEVLAAASMKMAVLCVVAVDASLIRKTSSFIPDGGDDNNL